MGLTISSDVDRDALIMLLCLLLTWSQPTKAWVGRAFVALRDSDIAAECIGVNLQRLLYRHRWGTHGLHAGLHQPPHFQHNGLHTLPGHGRGGRAGLHSGLGGGRGAHHLFASQAGQHLGPGLPGAVARGDQHPLLHRERAAQRAVRGLRPDHGAHRHL
ncbi:hypothetical protein DFAR_360004 [Desulfarculales bacterium]